MNDTLAKALAAFVPASVLFVGSMVLRRRERTAGSFLQVLGAGCLVVVVLTHVSEALQLFPWMHWGLKSQRRSLPRFSQCCPWSRVVSSRIFAK